jgi:hypothetical protein
LAGSPTGRILALPRAWCTAAAGLGQFHGQVKIHDDFDELPPDIATAVGTR